MKNVLSVLLSLMLLTVSGCTNSATLEVVTPSENDDVSISSANQSSYIEKDYLEIGFDLMVTEKIGGVYCSMPEADVLLLLGEPSEKETPELWGADELYHWDYTYSDIGLTINFASEEDTSGKISSYYIESDAFNGSTAKGIRIGSKRQEVLDAYEKQIDFSEMYPDATQDSIIIAGSMYGGIIFGFSDDGEVSYIFVGASAE